MVKKTNRVIETGLVVWENLSEMSGGISVIAAIVAGALKGSPQFWFCVAAYISVWIFVGKRLLRHRAEVGKYTKDNKTLIEAHRKELDDANAKHGVKIAELEQRITELATPILKIQPIAWFSSGESDGVCRIRVINDSRIRTADDVCLQIAAIESEDTDYHGRGRYALSEPYQLYPVENVDTITPGKTLIYRLFKIKVYNVVNVSENPSETVYVRFISAAIMKDSKLLDEILMRSDRRYKMELLVTARDCPRVRQEFYMDYYDDESDGSGGLLFREIGTPLVTGV